MELSSSGCFWKGTGKLHKSTTGIRGGLSGLQRLFIAEVTQLFPKLTGKILITYAPWQRTLASLLSGLCIQVDLQKSFWKRTVALPGTLSAQLSRGDAMALIQGFLALIHSALSSAGSHSAVLSLPHKITTL